jgi:hypothetical protein
MRDACTVAPLIHTIFTFIEKLFLDYPQMDSTAWMS